MSHFEKQRNSKGLLKSVEPVSDMEGHTAVVADIDDSCKVNNSSNYSIRRESESGPV